MVEVLTLLSVAAAATSGFWLGRAGRADRAKLSSADVEQAFERGRIAGAEQERQLLEVRVTPYQSKESQWLGLKCVLQVGYIQQLYYRGLPIGSGQTVVTNMESAWNEERVQQLLSIAVDVAQGYVKELVARGVKARLVA